MKKASQRAFRGGAAGFAAGVVQVRRPTSRSSSASRRSVRVDVAWHVGVIRARRLIVRTIHRRTIVRRVRSPCVRTLNPPPPPRVASRLLFSSSPQVGTFMWMRTTMNYQYANGGTLTNALQTLYKEGGIPRFYRGVSFAIIQNPLSRFGDTAANTGILVALGELCPNMPIAQQTAFASLGGASWRIALTPVDTFKARPISLALVPVRPRRRGERRSLRTFLSLPAVASLRPGSLAFNPDTPRRLSTPLLTPFNSTPTFVALYGTPLIKDDAPGPGRQRVGAAEG